MVHQYRSNGYNMVLDVNSGLIHVVDEPAYDMIGMFEDHTREAVLDRLKVKYPAMDTAELLQLYQEIEEMKTEGRLFSADAYEPYADIFLKKEPVVKALCLHIAHDCNLACKYCFAEEGEYHGRRAHMDVETGKLALDFLIRHSKNRRNLEVDFFGGEPLMDFDVIKELVRYGRELESLHGKRFRFTLTTNGVLLNEEIMEFADQEMSNVVLSLDGRKQVNDHMRPFRNGTGSYDLIIDKFQTFAAKRGHKNYYVRGTYTRHNLDFTEDVKHLVEMGFQQISMEPVVADESKEYAIRQEDIPKIKEEYDRLADYLLEIRKQGRKVQFFHFMIDLTGGPCVAKRMLGCGSGTEYMAVTPWGDLYPCHQFAGDETFLLGNVASGITNLPVQKKFEDCNVYAKDSCRTCFAKFYCSGGCAANAYLFQNNLNGVYEIGCELERKRIECAIMMKAAEAAN